MARWALEYFERRMNLREPGLATPDVVTQAKAHPTQGACAEPNGPVFPCRAQPASWGIKYGLSWLKVFLEGDERYRQFLLETPSRESDFRTISE